MSESLHAKQVGVARGMGIGLGVTIALIIFWAMRATVMSLDARIGALAAALTVVGAWLAVGIGNVARLRFVSADAIDAGSGPEERDPIVRNARAILQNTLEQAALAAVTYGSLAIAQERSRALIVALVALFSAGRVLFWAGYAQGAAARALGFALTFYPSVAGLLVALTTLIPV